MNGLEERESVQRGAWLCKCEWARSTQFIYGTNPAFCRRSKQPSFCLFSYFFNINFECLGLRLWTKQSLRSPVAVCIIIIYHTSNQLILLHRGPSQRHKSSKKIPGWCSNRNCIHFTRWRSLDWYDMWCSRVSEIVLIRGLMAGCFQENRRHMVKGNAISFTRNYEGVN